MRLLLINANTTTFVTDLAAAEARRVCAPGTEIRAVTAAAGPAIIGTRVEHALAERTAVELAAEHARDCAGVLIAVSYDTGLGALREALNLPVVGMTEAALHIACMLGGRIGLVGFGRRVEALYRERVTFYGLDSRIAGWRTLETTAPFQPGDTAAFDAQLSGAARSLVDDSAADVIVLLGAVMAGAPRRIEADVPVPVVDGIQCGVLQLEALIRLGARKPRTGSYASPGGRAVSGQTDAVSALLASRS
jgi:allantoin racemase